LINLKGTLEIMIRRTEARPIPSFLFVNVLEIGDSHIDKKNSKNAEDGREFMRAVPSEDPN
jgi:hypothetical protein